MNALAASRGSARLMNNASVGKTDCGKRASTVFTLGDLSGVMLSCVVEMERRVLVLATLSVTLGHFMKLWVPNAVTPTRIQTDAAPNGIARPVNHCLRISQYTPTAEAIIALPIILLAWSKGPSSNPLNVYSR
jgi:hypothetical protein